MAACPKGIEITGTFTFEPYTLDQQIAETEKELADLKARKAKEESERARTVGQRIVDKRVRIREIDTSTYGYRRWIREGVVVGDPADLAADIDSAIATAKAEQREKDARLAETYAAYVRPPYANEYGRGIAMARDQIADEIRRTK